MALTLPAWKAWTPGTDVEVAMTYYLPAAGVPSGMRLIAGSQTIGLKSDFRPWPRRCWGSSGGGDGGSGGTTLRQPERQPGGLQCLSDLATRGSRQWHRPHDQQQGVWQANWWTRRASELKTDRRAMLYQQRWAKLVCNY